MKKFFEWLKENFRIIFIIAFTVAFLIFSIIFSFKYSTIEQEKDLPHRFELVETFWVEGRRCHVLKDIGTNVLYLFTGYDAELLVDYEGKPVTWDPYGG